MKCENCDNEATHKDSEGVDLCYSCWIECCVLPGHKAEIERLKEKCEASAIVLAQAYNYIISPRGESSGAKTVRENMGVMDKKKLLPLMTDLLKELKAPTGGAVV